MLHLNKITADALCTAITIGYLITDNGQSTFLYEGEPTDHDYLLAKMIDLGIEAIFPDIQPQIPKQMHPLIYACKTTPNNDREEQNAIDQSLMHLTNQIEADCNNIYRDAGFYGAYIGGVARNGNIRLFCPSLLKQYPLPEHVIPDANYNINRLNYYNSFFAATQRILEIFSELPNSEGQPLEYPNSAEANYIIDNLPRGIGDNIIFGSVHGLVNSMTVEPPDTLPGGCYNIELALSRGTNKVASCMPCAIFAKSQNKPASYVHLGRGDYWNMPNNCNNSVIDSWQDFVIECCNTGSNYLINNVQNKPQLSLILNDFINNDNINYIPEYFLSALTFPDSFVSRMTNTLNMN